jgi:ADP-ribosylglycohydrolase
MASEFSLQERYRGPLLGLAICDALGATVEFKQPGAFEPVTGLIGDGIHRLSAGYWTDETSLALCLATSILETNQFDLRNQIELYLRWYRHGYPSSTGECFDIDTITRSALEATSAPAFRNPAGLIQTAPAVVPWHASHPFRLRFASCAIKPSNLPGKVRWPLTMLA